MAMTNKPKQAESTKPSAAQIIAELTRARCVFQLEAIRTIMGVLEGMERQGQPSPDHRPKP